MGTAVSAHWCQRGPWLGRYDDWGRCDSCGPESFGTNFIRVLGGRQSSGTSARAGSHSISTWPLHVAWASSKYGGVGVVGLLHHSSGLQKWVSQKNYGSCMTFFWFTLKSRSIILSVGYKWVTKDGLDSEEGLDPISWWEECQRICGSVLNNTVYSLATNYVHSSCIKNKSFSSHWRSRVSQSKLGQGAEEMAWDRFLGHGISRF